MESESARAEAREASELQASQALLEDLESQYLTVKRQRDALQEQLKKAEDEVSSLNEKLAAQQELAKQGAERSHELALAQQQIKALKEEHTNVQERFDRSQKEADDLREEISRLMESNKDLSKKNAEYEVQSRLKESEAIPLFHEKQRLQTELESLQKHATWLEQELEAKSKDYQKLQQDSRDRNIQLQMQLEQTTGDKLAAEARYEELQKIEEQLELKVEELSRDLLACKKELADLRETTDLEIQEERRLVEIQKQHLARWEHRYNDAIRENESLKKAAEKAAEQNKIEVEQQMKALEEKYTILLKEQASENANRSTSLPLANTAQLTLPSTNIDHDRDDGPLNLTDLYAQLESTKSALRQEKARADRAELLNERIIKDIREKAPIMNRQREEFEYAVEQLNDYQHRLNQALEDKEEAFAESKEARQEITRLRKIVQDKQYESQELAKQVQALLLSRAGGQVSPDFPTNREEFLEQNRQLIVERRRLQEQVADLERRLQSDTLRLKFEEAEQELSILREEREKQETAVAKIVQQRDLYRAILHKEHSKLLGADGDLEPITTMSEKAKKLEEKCRTLEDDLSRSRSEIHKLKREGESVSERLGRFEVHNKELVEENARLQRELTSARGDAAREESKTTYYKQKVERLEQSMTSKQSEISELLKSKNDVDRINGQLQDKISSLQSQVGRFESDLSHWEMKLRLSETQRDTARAAEQRLAQENHQLRTEAAQHGALVDHIRRMESMLSARNQTELESLRGEIERLTKSRATQESKHAAQVENFTGRIQELESRIQDLESSKEKAQSESISAKKALIEVKTENQTLMSKLENTETQLRSAKRKLGETDEGDDIEVALKSRIDKLTLELESSRAEKASLEEQLETYKKLAKDSENSLKELQDAMEMYKSTQEKETEDLRAMVESLKKESNCKQEVIIEMTTDLANQRDEREKREADLKAEIDNLNAALRENNKNEESSEAALAALQLDIETIRTELVKTQENYERELQMHSQARTALRAAREQAQEETRQRLQAENQLQALRSESEKDRESLESEKKSLRESNEMLEKSLQAVREQNNVLHGQIESLGQLVERNQESRIADVSGDSDHNTTEDIDQMQKRISELKEVVRFMRSENEVLQAQLNTAKRAVDRESAALQVAKRHLEEARAEIRLLQSKDNEEKTADSTLELSDKLKASEEQVTLLRESNKLLREEADKTKVALHSTEAELNSLRETSKPVEQVKHDLESKIAALEAEKESLQRELQTWKSRVENLVSKFNQIDPEEHKQALKQIEDLKKEKESLNAWKKTTEEENTRIREIARSLNQKLREQKGLIEGHVKEIEKLKSEKAALESSTSAHSSATKERDELKEKIKKMENEIANIKKELEGANTRNDKLRERLRQFQSTIRELRESEHNLKEQLDSTTKADTTVTQMPSKPLIDTHQTEPGKTQISPPQLEMKLPSAPDGGFKFGPSEKVSTVEGEQASLKTSETAEKSDSVANANAPDFTPNETQTAAPKLAVNLSSRESQKNESIDEQKDSSLLSASDAMSGQQESATGEPAHTASILPESLKKGESSEMSMKEKLMAKKRKMAEILEKKRKLAEETIAETGEEEQTIKKAKIAEQEEKPEVDEGSSDIQGKESTNEVQPGSPEDYESKANESKDVAADEATALHDDKEEQVDLEVIEEETADEVDAEAMDRFEGDQNKQEDDEAKLEETALTATGEKDTPTSGMSSPFGTKPETPAPTFGSTTTFGNIESSASTLPTSFGFNPEAQPAFGSGAFLNIKPPGSSPTPTFSFGSSGMFKLPTPTQTAPSPSPFGAFGSGATTFGSFGASGAISRSIFGSAPIEETGDQMEDEKAEDEEANDAMDEEKAEE